MQRLLRSRALYLALGSLSLLLYLWPLLGGSAVAPRGSPPLTRQEVIQSVKTRSDRAVVSELEFLNPSTLRAIQRRAPWLGLALGLQLVSALGMILGGLWLTVRALRTGAARAWWRGHSAPPPAWTLGEVWRIGALVFIVMSLLPFVRMATALVWPEAPLDIRQWIVWSMLGLDTLLILAVLAFASSKHRAPLRAVGLSNAAIARPVAVGFRGYVGVFPWLVLLLILVVEVVNRLGITPPPEPLQELLLEEQRPHVLGLTALLACLIGPFAEELYFRGVIYAALRRRLSRVAAMVISGVVFAASHLNPIGFVPMVVLGCLLADLYERTGSLASPLAIHIFHNMFLLNGAMAMRYVLSP